MKCPACGTGCYQAGAQWVCPHTDCARRYLAESVRPVDSAFLLAALREQLGRRDQVRRDNVQCYTREARRAEENADAAVILAVRQYLQVLDDEQGGDGTATGKVACPTDGHGERGTGGAEGEQ